MRSSARMMMFGLRTCSRATKRPPGRRTRDASATAWRSSGMLQSAIVHTICVEALIVERERLRVSADKFDLTPQALRASVGDLQHGGTDFDPRNLHIGWVERQVAPGANGNLQHLPSSLRTGPARPSPKRAFR